MVPYSPHMAHILNMVDTNFRPVQAHRCYTYNPQPAMLFSFYFFNIFPWSWNMKTIVKRLLGASLYYSPKRILANITPFVPMVTNCTWNHVLGFNLSHVLLLQCTLFSSRVRIFELHALWVYPMPLPMDPMFRLCLSSCLENESPCSSLFSLFWTFHNQSLGMTCPDEYHHHAHGKNNWKLGWLVLHFISMTIQT